MAMMASIRKFFRELKERIHVGLSLLFLLWIIFIVNAVLFGGNLNSLGIHPRDTHWIWGILCSPFLHGSFSHIFNNSVGILMVGSLVLLHGIPRFWFVTVISGLIAGVGVWFIGMPATNHIGYSGIIFGYLGYLLSKGFFDKRISSILLALFTGFSYGGMLFGVLPVQVGVSWEGHLCGFIGGIVAAFVLGKEK